MKFILLILLSALPAFGQANFSLLAIEPRIAASGTCPEDDSPSQVSDQVNEAIGVARADASYFAGQAGWHDEGTPRTICKVGFEVTSLSGDLSGLTYTAYIYALSGENLGELKATSTGKAGSSMAVGWNYFTLPTPFATSGGGESEKYAIFFTPNSHSLENHVWVSARDSDNIPGWPDIWDSSGNINFGSGHPASTGDISIKIFWQ